MRRGKKYIKLKNKYCSLEEYRIGGYHKSFLRKDVLRKKWEMWIASKKGEEYRRWLCLRLLTFSFHPMVYPERSLPNSQSSTLYILYSFLHRESPQFRRKILKQFDTHLMVQTKERDNMPVEQLKVQEITTFWDKTEHPSFHLQPMKPRKIVVNLFSEMMTQS